MKIYQKLDKEFDDDKQVISRSTELSNSPSLKTATLFILIYLFGAFPIVIVMGLIIKLVGFSEENAKFNLSSATLIVQILLVSIMIYLLVQRHNRYLFSDAWKLNLSDHLTIGLKWSIPFMVFDGVGILSSNIRDKWLAHYAIMTDLKLGNISVITVILFSTSLLVITIFEELMYRGIIQQRIQSVLSPALSVSVTSAIFALSHCIFSPVTIKSLIDWYLIGVLCGFAFNKSHSCISSFIPHLMNNAKYIIFVPMMSLLQNF